MISAVCGPYSSEVGVFGGVPLNYDPKKLREITIMFEESFQVKEALRKKAEFSDQFEGPKYSLLNDLAKLFASIFGTVSSNSK